MNAVGRGGRGTPAVVLPEPVRMSSAITASEVSGMAEPWVRAILIVPLVGGIV
jgi:hypothetical protein